MTRARQFKELRRLDGELNPWGAPGVWPDAGTDCWVLVAGDIEAVRVLDEKLEVRHGEYESRRSVYLPSWDEQCFEGDDGDLGPLRFRTRWTPDVPPEVKS